MEDEEKTEEKVIVWNKTRDFTLENRLFVAAEEGNCIILYKILKTKLVNVNATDHFKNTALMLAVRGGHMSIVQMLVESGADVNCANSLLVTPLHEAATRKHVNIVKLLVLAGANPSARNIEGLLPKDYCPYNSECWQVLQDAAAGEMPDIQEVNDVPEVPDYALEQATGMKKKKKKKGSAKGKKGKKKGKGSGKKKGKKKKK